MVPKPRDVSPSAYPMITNNSSLKRMRSNSSLKAEKGSLVDLENWGYPGYLTDQQFGIYNAFKEEIYRRDASFRATVFSFGESIEEKPYAICRWLRARKFVLSDAIEMVTEATKCREKHVQPNFYENPMDALGVEVSTYVAQYPQFYCGFTKKGCPLFISKPGVLSTSGLECITTIEGILKYHWFEMIHNFGGALRESISRHYDFKRFEVVCIIDLAHLSSTQVNKRALNIVKIQSQIDSLCFPETLNRLLVVNAPSFFSLTWKVIKGWIDERTANKVEIYSNRKNSRKRLLELVNENELPSDYGGKAISTALSLDRHWLSKENKNLNRQVSKLVSVRSSSHFNIELIKNESMRSTVFTRCMTGAKFYIKRDGTKQNMDGVIIKHEGEGIDEENPTRVDIMETVQGPCTVKIRIERLGSTLSSKNFLFVGKISDNTQKIMETKPLVNNLPEHPIVRPSPDTIQQLKSSNIDSLIDTQLESSPKKKDVANISKSKSTVDCRGGEVIPQYTTIRTVKSLDGKPPVNKLSQPNTVSYSLPGSASFAASYTSAPEHVLQSAKAKAGYYVVEEEDVSYTRGSFLSSCGWRSCF